MVESVLMTEALFPYLVVMAVGAVSLVMGFILVARGIGGADGESNIKFIGIEVRTSKVGPGVIFASFGIALIALAVWRLPQASPAADKIAAEFKEEQAKQSGEESPGAVDAATPVSIPAEVATSVAPAVQAGPPTVAPNSEPSATATALLRRALEEAAAGRCPADLLEPLLRTACEQQMPAMAQNLVARGPITAIRYEGSQPTPNGAVDVFTVQYSTSRMTWLLSQSRNGKLDTLFAPTN